MESLFGAILASFLAAGITGCISYVTQRKLLLQQLEFQRKQFEQDAAMREQIHKEQIAATIELHNTLAAGISNISANLSTLSH